MNQFAIVTDGAANITTSIAEEYGIVVVPLRVVYEGGILDEKELEEKLEFFYFNHGGRLPSTHSPAVGQFEAAYQTLIDQGYNQILSVHMSSALSKSANHAVRAAENICKHISDQVSTAIDNDLGVTKCSAVVADKTVTITVVDSRSVSIGEGVLCIEALALADAGYDMKTALKHVVDIRNESRLYLIPRSIDRIAQTGWIKRMAGIFSRLSNKRMVVTFDQNGRMEFDFKSSDLRDACAWVARALADDSHDGNLVFYKMEIFGESELKLLEKPLHTNELHAHCLGFARTSPEVSLYVGSGAVGVYSYPASLSSDYALLLTRSEEE